MFGSDAPVPPDQECDRQSQNSPIKLSRFRIAHHHRIIHLEALVELAHGFWSVIHGNADDLQALAAILILQFNEMRDLVAAGIAPGCPEIQENDFASIRGETQPL